MGGFFGGGRSSSPAPTPAPQPEVSAAQTRQEERAEAQEKKEMQGAQRRRRVLRTGGLRLLFSPSRQEGPGSLPKSRKMGGGS